MGDRELFTYKLRKATKKVHAISDTLVNAKLALSINSDSVWAEGLLVFYEIFKFLEHAMLEREYENIGQLLIEGLPRTEAFEEDLKYYYGKDWKKLYEIRESVNEYLTHLKNLLENDSDMLIPYIYHLYMGLLSGGQILKKKKDLKHRLLRNQETHLGEAVTDFGFIEIPVLKKELKNRINLIAETLDEEKKNILINEGKKVFELNNTIIRSIGNTDKVLLERALLFALCTAIFLVVYTFQLSR